MSKPFVTIVVPVLHERTQIKECVISLTRQTYPQKNIALIVIIDGKGDSRIKDDLEVMGIKNLIVLQNKRFGSASARNLGTSLADKKTKYFAFTDADCIASKVWLSTLVSAIEDLPGRVGCVGGANPTPKNDPPVAQIIGHLEQTLLGGGGSVQGSKTVKRRRVASIPNCNALYRAEWWHKASQDERFIVGQDGEFNYRLAQKGCGFVVVPGAIIWHHRPSSVFYHVRRMYKYGIATARIFRKHPGILKVRWYAMPPVLLVLGSVFLGVLGIILPLAWTLLAISLGVYGALILFTMLQVALRSAMWSSWLVLFLLPAQHIFYAFGFLSGLIL